LGIDNLDDSTIARQINAKYPLEMVKLVLYSVANQDDRLQIIPVASIYSKAYVTTLASSAADVGDRFLGRRLPIKYPNVHIPFRI
jgi:hypothetical protein